MKAVQQEHDFEEMPFTRIFNIIYICNRPESTQHTHYTTQMMMIK